MPAKFNEERRFGFIWRLLAQHLQTALTLLTFFMDVLGTVFVTVPIVRRGQSTQIAYVPNNASIFDHYVLHWSNIVYLCFDVKRTHCLLELPLLLRELLRRLLVRFVDEFVM